MSSIHASPKGPGEFLSASSRDFFKSTNSGIHNRMILWEAVFGCVGRSNVTFFLCHPSMKQCPLGCGERRLAGAHNSPATLLHLPFHPYYFLTNTETLLTLSPVRTRSRSPSRGGKRPGPTALLQAGERRRKVYAELKKECFVCVDIKKRGVVYTLPREKNGAV